MNIFSTHIRQFALTFVLLFLCIGFSKAQQLLIDEFNYTGNATSNGWTAFSSAGVNPIATTTGLTYSGHTGSGIGNAVQLANTSGEDISKTLSSSQTASGQTLYYSALINVNELNDKTGDYFLMFGNGTSSFCARMFVKTTGSVVNFGISNNSTGNYGSTAFARNTTYLAIVKLVYNTTTTADVATLWVLPGGMPATEAAAGTPEATVTIDAAFNTISFIGLRQGNGTINSRVIVDAIRAGTTWSSIVTEGALPPTVTTDAASLITTSDVQLNATVNANNSTTTVKFQYGLTTSYGDSIDATPSTVNGTSPTSVTATLSLLTPNTEYNYRAKGESVNGTTFGNNISFVTLALTPVAPTVNGATSTTLDISVNSDGNPAYTQYAIQEETSGNYVQGSGALGATAVWQSASTWSVITVSGLAPNTIYAFKVKARNTALVETAFGATSQDTTLVNTNPIIYLTGALNQFTTVAGSPSFSQNYSVSGDFLTSNIDITAPADFQITLDTNTAWGNALNLAHSSGTVPSTVIYVRYFPSTAGTTGSSITHVSGTSNNPSLAVNGIALEAEPTLQSSITLSSVTNNSMNVLMSGGDGGQRLVIASASPVTYVPNDGGLPSGIDNNFSAATDLGGNNRAVFSGSGNSFTLSGLSPATTYYLASYEYNGNGVTINYLTVSPGTASAITYPAPPTAVGTPVAKMKLDTLYLTFAGGNGEGRLVVISEAAAVTLSPEFGQTFTGVNSNYSLATDQGSNNRIVYDGSGSSATITGINRNTQYGIKVIEFNGSGSNVSYYITASGAISVTTPDYQPYTNGQVYTQDFNSLPFGAATYTTTGFGAGPYYYITPPLNAVSMRGWQYATLVGTAGADVVMRADTGNSSTAAIYNWSNLNASTDRALGFLAGNSFTGTAGITFVNSSAEALYHATITYDGELYRNGGNSGAINQLKFQYALGTDSLLGLNWVEVSDLTYTISTSAGAGAVNGNTNVTPLTATFNIPASWLPGELLTIRIIDNNDAGNDNGLAVDNFTFTAIPATSPLAQDSMITFSSVMTTSMTVNWLNGDGAGRIVVMNTANSFTNPVNGTNPAANPVYSGSGEQVIYNGSGSTVNVTNLIVGTTYYVRVFAYNGMGVSQTYAIQAATDNPSSQQTTSATPPTALSILNINNGNAIKVNQPFSITLQAVDGSANPQNVNVNTTVTVTLAIGSGNLSGTMSGVITSGNNTVVITGLLYDVPEMGVELLSNTTSGMTLSSVQSAPFEVFDVAAILDFLSPPVNAVTGVTAPVITVKAYRNDFSPDINYTDNITLTMVSGPAAISGTLTKAAIGGQVDFNDIIFTTPGSYVLSATSGTLTPPANISIYVSGPVAMNELVVPMYFGSKQSSGSTTSNTRTPVIACISFSNLIPDSTYSVYAGLALTTETAGNMGAGTMWNGSSFTIGGYTNMFTADASGNSGPQWIAIQPSGNSTRFGAGDVHTIRVAIATSPFGTTIPSAQFSTAYTITALDIPSTAYDANTANDGAFLTGLADTCMQGRFALVFSNELGGDRPLSVSGIVNSMFTNTNQSDLPSTVSNILANNAAKGSFACVIPIGANNADGVKRIEVRGGSNVMINYVTDSDGNWPSGNPTTATRRQVIALSNADVSMNTLTSLSISSTTNVTCFGGNDGSATAVATTVTPFISYTWTPFGGTDATANNLTAGNYSVLAVDAANCRRTASTTITEPSQFPVTVSNDGPDCIGDSIQLSVTGGVSYSWSGPNGFSSTDQNPLLINVSASHGGIYTVVITDASGCTQSGTTTVSVFNCNCTPPAMNALITDACNGTASGNIDLSVTGGEAPYSYLWSNGATTEDITTLLPGTYLVTVTDNITCIAQQSFVVGNILPPTVAPLGSTTFCQGGSVDLLSSAGDSYLWSNGETTQTITVTISGDYSVTVTTGSCSLTSAATNVTVNAFGFTGVFYTENLGSSPSTTLVSNYNGWQNGLPITYTSTSASQTDVRNSNASTGYTGSSGTANIFFTTSGERNFVISGINSTGYSGVTLKFGLKRDGGADPMNVEYSTDGTNWTNVHSSVPANTSWALITVAGSLPAAENLRIRFTKPTGPSYRVDDISLTGTVTTPSITMTGNDSVCGAGSAILTSNLTSGILWSTGATTKSITVSSTGSYSYTATDGNGCTASVAPVAFTVNPEPIGSVTSGTIACNGGATDVVVSASGGTEPYSGIGTFNVGAGGYTYIITDNLGCDDTVSITVNQPNILTASSTYGAIACNGGSTTVDVTADGGTAPYTGTGTFTVTAGPYSYTITDTAGCTAVTSGTISEPAAIGLTSFTPSSGITGTTVTINGVSFTGVTGVKFNGVTATFTFISDTEISADVPAGATTGLITVESPCGNVASSTSFIINASTVTLNLKLYLQGYYIGGGMMSPALFNQGVGTSTTVADTITVELHDPLSTATIVYTTQAILHTDGTATVTYPSGASGGSYYIVIVHRNHLQTWSKMPVTLGTSTSYDFSMTTAPRSTGQGSTHIPAEKSSKQTLINKTW